MNKYDPAIHNEARPNAGVTIVPLIFNQNTNTIQTLIYRRSVDSFSFPGCICLPNGVYDRQMSLNSNDAAVMTLKEKLSIRINHMEQLYTFSGGYIDPNRINTINITYWSLLRRDEVVEFKDPTFQSEWVDVEVLLEKTSSMFAFNHKEVLNMAVDRLKSQAEYLPVALSLLPHETTIPEFKSLTELLIGEALNNTRFRDRIKRSGILVEVTGRKASGVTRKSQLYSKSDDFKGHFYPKNPSNL